jgi:hypothetical protein
MSPERQRHLLFGLLGVMALVGAWQFLSASAPEAPAAVRARRAAARPTVPAPPVSVGVTLLEGPRSGPDDGGRNPFAFGARAVAAANGPRASGPPREVPPPPAFTAPGPPPLPPIPFKFIGLVEGASSARRIAVLSDSKGLVVHGSEGTIIDGRFRILSIGPESIDIAYADGRGRQTLRLSGQ